MSKHKYYTPDFLIKVNEQQIPASLRAAITSVTWYNDLDAADKIEISIHDPSEIWFKNPLLKPDNEISLALGYASEGLDVKFEGDIIGQTASFQQGGGVTLKVEAMDRSQRLMGGTKERSFGLLPDSAIIVFAAVENGLLPEVDSQSAFLAALAALLGHARRQANKSDYNFLKEMATEIGLKVWVEKNTLYVKKLLENIDIIEADWGRSLINFNPRISTVGQIEGVSIKLWLKELKLDLVITIGWDFDNDQLKINVVPSKSETASTPKGKPVLKLVNQPVRDPTDLAKVMSKALSELKSKLNNMITGSGSLIGDPKIAKGSIIRLNGIGNTFSGKYRLKSTTHTINTSGYKVNFQGYQEIIPEFLEL